MSHFTKILEKMSNNKICTTYILSYSSSINHLLIKEKTFLDFL